MAQLVKARIKSEVFPHLIFEKAPARAFYISSFQPDQILANCLLKAAAYFFQHGEMWFNNRLVQETSVLCLTSNSTAF